MIRIILDDGFSTDDVILRVQGLCRDEYGEKQTVIWDLSGLTAVPWGQLIPMSTALAGERTQLENTVSDSFVILPRREWRMALNLILRLYSPSRPITMVVVASGSDPDPELARELQLV